jgi:2,4-dienoyl-CoA reductase-like NADH-dependent reductase (Old Yellow Enzyme family)
MENKLFSTIKIREIEFRNRIFMPPMCQYSANDGVLNDWHMTHYLTRSIGGVGGIIVEASAVEPRGRITPYDLGIYNDLQESEFSRLTRSVKEHGAKIGIQLAHAGRKASNDVPWRNEQTLDKFHGGWDIIAPSPIPFDKDSLMPKEMTTKDISDVLSAFEIAAKRAVKADFDFIEIHMAHGYLLHEFLSPLTNKRNDDFGSSFENRIRFPLEVARKVRNAIPKSMPLFVRISATDWIDGGWDVPQSIEFVKKLREIGIDLIDVSSAGISPEAVIPVDFGFQTKFSQIIRENSSILTGAVGMIVDPYQAEHTLCTGQSDIVLLGRELLRNPYWSLHAAKVLKQNIKWPLQYLRAKLS